MAGWTVAFAGHARSADTGDHAAHVAAVVAALHEVWHASATPPLLIVGAAENADRIAIDTWRELGGTVTIVRPFLPQMGKSLPERSDDAVWLDGAAAEAVGIHPHLDQTRWLICHADLLVASWSGAPARGPGGTADAVALAVRADLPVVWIKPGRGGPAKLIRSDRISDQTELAELAAGFGAALPDATADAIAEQVQTHQPQRGETAKPRLLDRLLAATLWNAYARFRRAVGGRPTIAGLPLVPPPPDLMTQAGYLTLTARFDEAEAHANEQAGIHRSEQLLLILIAVVATAVGASPLPKLVAVVTEFSLALIAFAIWWTAERSHRHERWGTARHDAEELRIARAGWAIGVRPWTGPRGLAAVPPPSGAMTHDRRQLWMRWGLSELIDGQRSYHMRQGQVDRRISHRMERLENGTFALLLVTMATVIVATAIHGGISELPIWATDVTVMVGALVPVIGAASMALEAKFGFSEHAARSAQLVVRLQEIAQAAGPDATPQDLKRAARQAIEALRSEGSLWAEGIHRRVLFRGG